MRFKIKCKDGGTATVPCSKKNILKFKEKHPEALFIGDLPTNWSGSNA